MSAAMTESPIEDERLEDCLAVTTSGLGIGREAILAVEPQEGGLFNYLLRVETRGGRYFFKQYLDGVDNPIYDLPEIPAGTRSELAAEVQRIAAKATATAKGDVVPRIVCFDRERNAFLMSEAAGERPLNDYLSQGEIPSSFARELPRVLGALHGVTHGVHAADSIFGNRAFRDFKLKIQYDDIAEQLSAAEGAKVRSVKASYQARADCVTHGDINSRNILADAERLGVIDFEQSHLGTPAYDLSYILCEAWISLETFANAKAFLELLAAFLDRYFEIFDRADRESVEREITPHLAIQTIYRFWGPSRHAWTFYVDDATRERIIERSRSLLMKDTPITAAFAE